MRTSPGNARFDNDSTATLARLALTPKHMRKAKVASLFALGIHIVAISRSALLDA